MPVYKYRTAHGPMYYIKLCINGKQYCKRGFTRKQDAIIYEAGLFKNVGKHKVRFKVSDVIPLYEKDLKNRVKITTFTQNGYVLRKHIYPFFNDYYVDKISALTIQLFYDQTIKNPVYQDKNKIFQIAHDFLSFLKNYDLPDINITLKAPYNSNPNIRMYNYYTREEFEKFLKGTNSKRYRLIFLLLFNYGLRVGELLALKHSDFTKDKVFIRHSITSKTGNGQREVSTKNKSSKRIYPMLECIRDAYVDYIHSSEYHSGEHLFTNGTTLTIGETPIRAMQKRMEQATGSKHIKLHEFRHSCASELINQGFTPEQVASWLGHKSSVTTLNTYFHLFPSKQMEIANYYNKVNKKVSN